MTWNENNPLLNNMRQVDRSLVCDFFYENFFPLLNNIAVLALWIQIKLLIVEEPTINFLEIIFILLLEKNFDMAKNIRDFLKNLFE